MKNVTISMKEEVLREVRIEAAKAGKSVSRFIADMIDAEHSKAGGCTVDAQCANGSA